MSNPGEVAKARGLDAVEGRDPSFVATMRQIARRISVETGRVSADDLRRYAQDHGIIPKHPNAWGAIFRGPGWELIGTEHSLKATNRARRISVWRYVGVK